jgi:hypothetical protein
MSVTGGSVSIQSLAYYIEWVEKKFISPGNFVYHPKYLILLQSMILRQCTFDKA